MSGNGKTAEAVKVEDNKITIIDPSQIKFKGSKIGIFDLEDVNKAVAELRFRDAIRIMMRAAITIPPEVGDPDDIESFRGVNRSQWSALMEAYGKAYAGE